MEGDLPAWFDDDFLKLAIADGKENTSDIEIVDYDVKPAVESNNNYCSVLYRVTVQYHLQNDSLKKSLIIKAPLPEDNKIKAIVEEANFLKNEVNVYTQVFPRLYEVSNKTFTPSSYFCQVEDVLILEDLRETGYTMCDRLDQLDLPHCQQFMKTLAQYHAATVALHKAHPLLVEENGNEPLYTEKIKSGKMKFITVIKILAVADMIKKYDHLESLSSTIHRIGESIIDFLIKAFNFRGKVNVLTHGDCWTNNILFQHDEKGDVTDCKLIDFQIRRYGSPAIDIVYFLLTSPKNQVRETYMDELLDIYCDTLNPSLAQLGCSESLSKEELEAEMREMCPWALNTVANFLPLILNDIDLSDVATTPHSEESIQSLDINVNPYLKPLLSKTFNKVLPRVCEGLITFGVLDYFTHGYLFD